MPKAKPLIMKENGIETPAKDAQTLIITEYVMIDYNLILDEVLRNTSEELTFDYDAFLNPETMRRILHIDVLNTLIMRAIAFKHSHEHIQWLEWYYYHFHETYSRVDPIDEYSLDHHMLSELRMDDFITKIPGYNPYERIHTSKSSWLNPETMSNVLYALLGENFNYVTHGRAFCNCRSCIYDKILEEVLCIPTKPIHINKIKYVGEIRKFQRRR